MIKRGDVEIINVFFFFVYIYNFLMRRRNTIDSSNGTWPLCRYYYTHNNGSCDDILLFSKEIAKRQNARKRLSPIRKKRRYTYPIPLLDQKAYQQQLINSGQITRRWSTIRTTKKRQTLANILSSLSDGNIIKSSSSKTLNEKWESIQLFKRLYTEKTEQSISNIGQSSNIDPAALIIEMPTGTTTTLMDSNINISSSIVAHPPTSFARQETEYNSINMEYTISPEAVTPLNSPPLKESLVDVLLFLFGFLIFPLWWIGAWYYVTKKKDSVTKSREVFQLLNCCMSLVSLLLIGLMIGLTTVWA